MHPLHSASSCYMCHQDRMLWEYLGTLHCVAGTNILITDTYSHVDISCQVHQELTLVWSHGGCSPSSMHWRENSKTHRGGCEDTLTGLMHRNRSILSPPTLFDCDTVICMSQKNKVIYKHKYVFIQLNAPGVSFQCNFCEQAS